MSAVSWSEERLRTLAVAAHQAFKNRLTKDNRREWKRLWTIADATLEVYQEEASPETILALLDELTRLRQEVLDLGGAA